MKDKRTKDELEEILKPFLSKDREERSAQVDDLISNKSDCVEFIPSTRGGKCFIHGVQFYKSLNDGLWIHIRDHRLESSKKWYEKQSKEKTHQYYLNNIEYAKTYYLENKEKMKEYSKERYLENKEELNAYSKQYYLENKEKLAAYAKQYYLKNKKQ